VLQNKRNHKTKKGEDVLGRFRVGNSNRRSKHPEASSGYPGKRPLGSHGGVHMKFLTWSGIDWRGLRQSLFPAAEEEDPEFRQEIARVAVLGLRVIAFIILLVPLFMLTAKLLLLESLSKEERWQPMLIIPIGLVLVMVSFLPQSRCYARVAGCVGGFLVFVTFMLAIVVFSTDPVRTERYLPANFASIMLAAVTALPLKPTYTLALGLSMWTSYLGMLGLLMRSGKLEEIDPMHALMTLVVTLIATVLTAVLYNQRLSAYRASKQCQRSYGELCLAETRLLVSEGVASQSRLAAVLSHELNSPIAVLNSSVDMLLQIVAKYQRRVEDVEELAEIRESVARAARESSQRVMEILERMRRFTNLDRAEEQAADLNQLLTDTASLLEPELCPKATVTLDLKPLPLLKCRPQQLGAVFSNLLRNAAFGIEGKGNIWISSVEGSGEVVIRIRDDGRGISEDKLQHLFEPTFSVNHGRVSSSNWGLFSSRSVVVAHGGDIRIESAPWKGTSVTVSLPVLRDSVAA
jgi:signal transduction histidine kinase